VQAITAEQVSGDPLMVAIMKDAAAAKQRIAELERKLAAAEPKRAEAWAQVNSLKAQLAALNINLHDAREARDLTIRRADEKDGIRRTAEQNLLLAQQEITSLRTINGVQGDMLREATGQGAKVEMKMFSHWLNETSGGEKTGNVEKCAALLSALHNEGWTISHEQFFDPEEGWPSYRARLTRPVQQKPDPNEVRASVEALRRQGMFGPHQTEQVIINPPSKVPEPIQNALDPNSYIARIRAAGGDVDAVLTEDNTKNLTQAQAIGAAYVAANRPAAPPLPMLPAHK